MRRAKAAALSPSSASSSARISPGWIGVRGMIVSPWSSEISVLSGLSARFLLADGARGGRWEGLMVTVEADAAAGRLLELLALAEAGETVVIARAGTPVVQLVPVARMVRRRFGALAGQGAVDDAFFEPLPEEELERWA